MTYVYDFTEGDKDQKDLLGGKGANLAEMTNLGLPVPPGFTISTEACRAYLEADDLPEGLAGEIDEHLTALEKEMGRRLGEPGDPLLVSVRSGAAVSMPGMMETVLNVGLNDESVRGLAEQSNDERFALDSYRRLLQMFGATVLGIESEVFSQALDRLKKDRDTESDTDLGVDDLRGLVDTFKQAIHEHAGRGFPQDPREQLDLAMRAVFDSWNTERAALYRRQERIAEGMGTAVNVQAMVFGNRGDDSGSGVAFTRDPASGNQGVYGDYLQNAQGEDVVAGIRNTVSLADMERIDKKSHDELLAIMEKLEKHYHDMCDIEFTVERGKLWMLQTRVGKRTPGGGVPDRPAHDRRGPDRHRRGAAPRDRRPARPADVPALRREGRAHPARHGHERLPRCRRRQGRVRLGHRRRVGRARRGRDPGPQGDQPRRPPRDGRRPRHPHQPWRQDLPRSRGRARHGPHVRVRRRGHRREREEEAGQGARWRRDQRGRRDLDRRHHRRGVPGLRAGHRLGGDALPRGRARGGRPGDRRGPGDEPRRRRTPAPGPRERRHPRGRRSRPPVRGRGHRPVPDRAHVPGRAAPARGEPHRRRGRGRPGGGALRAAPAPARRLPRDPGGDGRAAGHDPADRPAPARVPAGLHRAVGQGRPGATRPTSRTSTTSGCSRP